MLLLLQLLNISGYLSEKDLSMLHDWNFGGARIRALQLF